MIILDLFVSVAINQQGKKDSGLYVHDPLLTIHKTYVQGDKFSGI